jgi:hypothetical protein
MRSYISKLQDKIGVQGRLPDLKSQRDRLFIIISVLALTALIALPVAAKDGVGTFEGDISGGVAQQGGGGGQCDLNPSASDCQSKPPPDPCAGITDPDCGKPEEPAEVVDSNGDGVSDDLENLAAVEKARRDAELGLTDDDSNGDGSTDRLENLAAVANDADGDGVVDSIQDDDGDGMTNVEEERNLLDTNDPDTDGDGVTDGEDPLHPPVREIIPAPQPAPKPAGQPAQPPAAEQQVVAQAPPEKKDEHKGDDKQHDDGKKDDGKKDESPSPTPPAPAPEMPVEQPVTPAPPVEEPAEEPAEEDTEDEEEPGYVASGAKPGSLPFSGANTMPIAAGALALVVAGSAMVLFTRRTRSS